MEGSESVFPDWAHLPQLFVQMISEKMKSISDYVRFRVICCPWRSASLSKPQHLPPQLPWLISPRWFSYDKKDDGIRLFYNPWESKFHKFHLPETSDMDCYASCRGWLLIAATVFRRREVFLLNPLTRAHIELPTFNTLVKHLGGCWDDPRKLSSYSYELPTANGKMTFSVDLTDPDCLITVLFRNYKVVLCCRVGDMCWTQVDISPNSLAEFIDMTYYNGRFYLLYNDAVEIIESNKPKERIVYAFEPELAASVPALAAYEKRFLEGKSGVYIIKVNIGNESKVYQFQEQPFKIKQITDTSNTAFFVDFNIWLALCSDDWDSLDGGFLV